MSDTMIVERKADLSASPTGIATILLVDDEPNILSALKRLLRPHHYTVLTAESGAAALELLARQHVDLIISDMRMPGMTGAQFLAQAKALYPDVVRILLTGYSEISTTVAAINEGGVYHYHPKPWDDHDLILTVRRGLEQQLLKNESKRLAALVQQQNIELAAFNRGLEKQVAARTEEIRQTVLFLESAQKESRSQFLTMLNVFSNMIEMRVGGFGGHSARVAELARKLALRLKLTEHHAEEVMIAGLLHGIGKLGLPDHLLRMPMDKMSSEETRNYMSHPVKGQLLLTPVAALTESGHIIGAQYERYDGRGMPESLEGEAICIGARILAVVRDFEELCAGAISTQAMPREKAISMLKLQSGHRYDPEVVRNFTELIAEEGLLSAAKSRLLKPHQLVAGMRLSDDLRTQEGVLLLTRNCVITPHHLALIRRFDQLEGLPLQIRVLSD